MRWRGQRDRARLVSGYADGLIARRRESEGEPARMESGSAELDELVDLVRALDAIQVVPSPAARSGIWSSVWRRSAGAASAEPRPAPSRPAKGFWRERCSARLTAGAVAGLLIALALLAMWRLQIRSPLAMDVLQGSQSAMAELLGDGRVLSRVWRVTSVIRTREGREERTTASVLEWLEGVHAPRIARLAYGESGRLLWRLLMLADDDGVIRESSYYPADAPGPLRGVVVIAPTRREYREAVARFPLAEQPIFEAFLDPAYGTGLVGERVFNRSMLGTWSADGEDPRRVVVSMREMRAADGEIHRLDISEPARLWFERDADGVLSARVARAESVRDISRADRLTRRSATNCWLEDGRQVFTEWTMVRMQVGSRPASDPFRTDVPPGTRTIRVSAFDELTRMAPALHRLVRTQSSSRDRGLTTPEGSTSGAATH